MFQPWTVTSLYLGSVVNFYGSYSTLINPLRPSPPSAWLMSGGGSLTRSWPLSCLILPCSHTRSFAHLGIICLRPSKQSSMKICLHICTIISVNVYKLGKYSFGTFGRVIPYIKNHILVILTTYYFLVLVSQDLKNNLVIFLLVFHGDLLFRSTILLQGFVENFLTYLMNITYLSLFFEISI